MFDRGDGKMYYKAYSTFIDTFGARPSGTKNLERAIDSIINLTRRHGINDITTEEVEAPHWVRGKEKATMILPYEKDISILGFGSSVSTSPKGITAEVVVVKSFEELDNLDIKDVSGKIVVYDVPYVSYGETVVYRTDGANRASMKGAVATLVRSITPFSLYTLHTGAQFYRDNITKIPTAAITHEDADFLKRLQDLEIKIVIKVEMINTFDTNKSRNTIIDLKGTTKPQKLVIVSGHIDSWDVGQGAMDDGGGMFLSWAIPVILNQLPSKTQKTVRAILWTAEEPGLVGAAAYLKKHGDELNDIDFIMESDEGTFKPLGLEVSGSEKALCIINHIMKEMSRKFNTTYRVEKNDSPGSDITIIVDKGVPGASLMNQNERYFWYHHSKADTMDVQNESDWLDCVMFMSCVTYVIANIDDIPRS